SAGYAVHSSAPTPRAREPAPSFGASLASASAARASSTFRASVSRSRPVFIAAKLTPRSESASPNSRVTPPGSSVAPQISARAARSSTRRGSARRRDQNMLHSVRLLCISDVHGHADALGAVLATAERQGYDRLVVLGDLC